MKRFSYAIVGLITFVSKVFANSAPQATGIHTAPIVLSAREIRPIQYHPIQMYRVFKSDQKGNAQLIPFQIDERDHYGDFILPLGANPNTKFSNGIFDGLDELSVMGNDVGPPVVPTHFKVEKPPILYEVLFKNKDKMGAIYIGAYFTPPPPTPETTYVAFNLQQSVVKTSRYQYRFDKKNYLVVNGIDILNHSDKSKPLIESSTFYLKTDFKYFLTFEINQTDIESELDAYKTGPIRTIARVNFNYNILKLNFDLGMYTEVSFFSNSVILPAIIDNPLDGPKSLNDGSIFYYGFNLIENPADLTLETNMPPYKEASFFDFLKSYQTQSKYFIAAKSKDYMVYLEMQPSPQMQQDKNYPMFYFDPKSAEQLVSRPQSPRGLGESRVNMAVSFKLDNLKQGFHEIALQMFIENNLNQEYLDSYKTLNEWRTLTRRIRNP